MFAIQNYTDTKCELELIKERLSWLIDKREELYAKYFPLTSKPKEVQVSNGSQDNDNMINYMHELYEVDFGTGKSLIEEIEYTQTKIKKLERYLNQMNNTLSKMKGIDYQLFYEIVVNGTSVTKAVELIAEKNNTDTSTIWRNNYKNIKKFIKKLKLPVICQ